MEHCPAKKKDMIGLIVKSRISLKNGRYSIPPGTTFTVTGYYRGLSLRSAPCAHCGVEFYITKVSLASVDIVESVPI